MNHYEQNQHNTPGGAPYTNGRPAQGAPNGAGQGNTGPGAGGPANTASGQPRQPADFGRQLGDSLHKVLQTGDISQLMNTVQVFSKDVGETVRTAMGDAGETVRTAVDEANQTVRTAMNGVVPPSGQQRQNGQSRTPYMHGGQRQTPRPYQYQYPQKQQKTQPPWYGKPTANPDKKPYNYAGVWQISVGASGLGIFGLTGLAVLATGAVAGMAFFVPVVAASAWLMGSGIAKHSYTKRLLNYQSLMMKKNVMTFDELAAGTGYPVNQIKKDFKKGMRKGTLKYVWLDHTGETVMLGENTYNLYLQAEETRRQKQLEEAERAARMENPDYRDMELFRTESAAMLERIRAANEAIPGEEITHKLDRLEETCAKIFACVEQNPKKLPDTRKFMSYYLPTTLKVVEKYRQYEEMEVQTPSIVKAKEEIENSLTLLDTAFNNLLDELYQEDTLDVSTDIEVLHTMLQQEGLTGQRFTIEADSTTTPQ